MDYNGPFPPELLVDIVARLAVGLCRTEAAQDILCEAVDYLFAGFGGDMQLIVS